MRCIKIILPVLICLVSTAQANLFQRVSFSDVSNDMSSVPVTFVSFELILSSTESELDSKSIDAVLSLTNDHIISGMEEKYNSTRINFIMMDRLKVVQSEWRQGRRKNQRKNDHSRENEARSRKIPPSSSRGMMSYSYTVIHISSGAAYFQVPVGYTTPTSAEITDFCLTPASSSVLANIISQSGRSDLKKVTRISALARSSEIPSSSPSANTIADVPPHEPSTEPTMISSLFLSRSPSLAPSLRPSGNKIFTNLSGAISDDHAYSPPLSLIIISTFLFLLLVMLACSLYSNKHSDSREITQEENEIQSSFNSSSSSRKDVPRNIFINMFSSCFKNDSIFDDNMTEISPPHPNDDDDLFESNPYFNNYDIENNNNGTGGENFVMNNDDGQQVCLHIGNGLEGEEFDLEQVFSSCETTAPEKIIGQIEAVEEIEEQSQLVLPCIKTDNEGDSINREILEREVTTTNHKNTVLPPGWTLFDSSSLCFTAEGSDVRAEPCRVRFCENLVTNIIELPRVRKEDIHRLFYGKSDYARFETDFIDEELTNTLKSCFTMEI